MEANFEFEGRGIRYAPGKFHLFSAVVDRESVFFEERQFKHSLTGDVAESNEKINLLKGREAGRRAACADMHGQPLFCFT